MKPSAIYSKTGKGVQEASGKTRELARADRAVLAAIDGKSTLAEVAQKLGKSDSDAKLLQLIEQLDRSGFIRLIAGGEATTTPSAPPAGRPGAAAATSPGGDLDFTQSLSKARLTGAAAAKPPVVDLAAQARAETERKAREESELRGIADAARARAEADAKARAERDAAQRAAAEAKARAEAEARVRREAEQRSRVESELLAKIAEAERLAKEAEERARREAEEKARREAEVLRQRLESERKAREEAERLAKEAEERARKEAEEKARREEEARRQREEEQRRAKEEAERRAREEAERKVREEAERKAREEAERKAREEAARKAREEAERKAKEEAERKAKEEAERKVREEAERKVREEAERKAREEAERKAREEAERRARAEAERKAQEAERARKEEAQARPAEKPGEVDLAASLLADLDSFSRREEEERKSREDADRKAKEEQDARRRREEEERASREAETAQPSQPTTSQPIAEEARPAEERKRGGKAKRRLAAIVASDIVGYSRLMGIDEEGTLERFRRILNEIIRPKVDEYGGRIFKTAGDGLLLEFPSVVEAARWAVDVQTAVASDQAGQSPARQIAFRMGVNLGDVIDEDSDLFGDGVNVAARLEGLAERGGVCISGVVYDHIHDKVPCKFDDIGPQKLKNIARPVRVFRMRGEWETVSLRRSSDLRSLPHSKAMASAAAAADEVEVTEEDLDLEEVKRDEQALSPEARTDALEREREKERLAKAIAVEPAAAGKFRAPRKWGRTVAVGVVVLLATAAGVLQFMPVSTAKYERAAGAALGTRVTIRSARMSVFGGLKLELEGVTVGDALKARKASASAGLGALFGTPESLSGLELDDAVVPQAELGKALFGALSASGLKLRSVTFKKLQLAGPVSLPPLDVELLVGPNGAPRSAKLRGPGNFSMVLARQGDQYEFEATADDFAPPLVPALAMSNYAMKGTASRSGMRITHFDAQLYDGTIAGDADIDWRDGWRVEGTLQVKAINAGVLAPTLLSQGTADASGRYSMSAADPAKLLDGAHLDGHFTIAKGVLGSFDLARAIRTKGEQGTGVTTFARMSGEGSYDAGAVRLRNVAIGAGALNAGASADIAPGGALSGRIIADVKTPVQTLSATLNLAGTVKAPKVVGK